jgi:hypothetical protein
VRIYKYPLDPLGVTAIQLHPADEPLSVVMIQGVAFLYVRKFEYGGDEGITRYFAMYPTGDLDSYPLHEDTAHTTMLKLKQVQAARYLGTVVYPTHPVLGIDFVFHAYEVEQAPRA